MSGVLLPPTSLAKRRRAVAIGATVERHSLSIGAAVAVGGLASANGGFFPVPWGWSTLAFCWAAAVALLLRPAVKRSVPTLVKAGAKRGKCKKK